VNFTFIIR